MLSGFQGRFVWFLQEHPRSWTFVGTTKRRLEDHMGSAGRALGTSVPQPIILEARPAEVARGRKRADPRQMRQRHHLPCCAAGANGTDCRYLGDDTQCSHLSTVGGDWVSCTECGEPLVEQCEELGWRGLGMAGGRRGDGQGTFGGDLIGPNPTDRGKAGSKRSLLVEGQGGPIEYCGCRSQTPTTPCQVVG